MVDRRLLTRATATKGFLVAVGVVGILHALLVLGQAWVLTDGIVNHSTADLPRIAWILLAIFTLRALLIWLNQVLSVRAAAAVKSQLRTEVMEAALAQPRNPKFQTAELITLVTQGLDALDGYFSKYLPQLILAATVPFIMLAAALTQDLLSFVIILVTLPLIPLFMALIGWTTRTEMAKRWQVQQRLANHFADLVAGLPTLQVFGRAKAQLKGLEKTEDANRKETVRTLRVAFLSSFALELLATLSVALVAVTVGFRIAGATLDFQTGLFLLILAPEAYLPVRQVGVHYHDSSEGVAAAEQAFAIIEASQGERGELPVPKLGTCPIVFEDVSLDYSNPDGTTVAGIRHFSATLAPGEVVALVGPSGSGKSSVLSLLLGFLPPTSGSIRIGHDQLKDLDQSSYLSQIAWVDQNPGMLRGNVAQNIWLGNPGAEETEVRRALDLMGGTDIALDRPVGDDGEGLSAGEQRRVALARALLKIWNGAGLLILDEPTAGLDLETETVVVEAVREADVSALIVTHRDAMAEVADRVLSLGQVRS